MVASFLDDGDINLYNLDNGECQGTLKGHTKEGYGMAFQGNNFVSGSGDNKVMFWNVESMSGEIKPSSVIDFH